MVGSRPRVVIAEDDTDLLEALVREFRSSGFDVFTARNGMEGFSRVLQARPDLIVLDLLMPERNGHEMMQDLLARHEWVRKIPVLITTNYGAGDSPPQDWVRRMAVAHVLKADVGLAGIVEQAKKLLHLVSEEVY